MTTNDTQFPIRGKWSKLQGEKTVSVDVLILSFSTATIQAKDGSGAKVCPVAVFQDLSDDSLRFAELKFITIGGKNAAGTRNHDRRPA